MLHTSDPSGHENMAPTVYLLAIVSAIFLASSFSVFSNPKIMYKEKIIEAHCVAPISPNFWCSKESSKTYQIQECAARVAMHWDSPIVVQNFRRMLVSRLYILKHQFFVDNQLLIQLPFFYLSSHRIQPRAETNSKDKSIF